MIYQTINNHPQSENPKLPWFLDDSFDEDEDEDYEEDGDYDDEDEDEDKE